MIRPVRDAEEMIARATDVMDRYPLLAPLAKGIRDGQTGRDAARRRRERRRRRQLRKLTAMIAVIIAATIATIAFAWIVTPIGVGGWLLVTLLTILACIAIGVWPADDAPPPAKLATAKPAVLPAQVDAWLDAKRRALPALAAPKVDAISAQLAALAPAARRGPRQRPDRARAEPPARQAFARTRRPL